VKKPVLPEAIAREVARAPKGKALVVDFVDYECPFCRENHAAFAAVLQAASGRVVVVRKQVPLTRMHRHAMDAARAACCGEVLGKGDPMSDALISAPVAELTPQGCERLAQSIGLDVARFRACVADPSTDARIASDIATFQASNGEHHGGLPTLWIGHQKLEGLQDRATLERAVARAIEESS
jgi:protein-disulfide isomerase